MSIRWRGKTDAKGNPVKGRGSYTCDYRVRNAEGRLVLKSKGGFQTMRDARAYEVATKSAIQSGTYIERTNMTVAQFVTSKWVPHLEALATEGKLRPTTVSLYRRAVVVAVVPKIGGVRLADLDAPTLNKLYAQLLANGRSDGRGGLSRTTVNSIHVSVGKMLRDAVRWGLLARNVAQFADAPSPNRPEMAIWTPEQLRVFLAHVRDDRLFAMWLTIITTGMRRGEIAGLGWPCIDLDGGELLVRDTRVVVDNKVIESGPKTPKGRRTVALDPVTVAALRGWRRQQLQERLAAGPAWRDGDYVFTDPLGQPLHPETISKKFQRRARSAGLPVIPLHGARHSYASAALEAGEDLKVVSAQLGHANLATTADLYAKVTERLRRQAANRTAHYILGGETASSR